MRRSRLTTVAFYVVGLGLLLGAWVFGNPPGSAPDEVSHYVRAVGAASGTVIGKPGGYGTFPRYGPLEIKFDDNPLSDPPFKRDDARFAAINAYTRSYEVPAGLYPVTFGCNAFSSTVSAQCEYGGVSPQVSERWLSQHAGQNPLPYLLAGPLMVTQNTPDRADWVGRLVLAFWCVLLIALPLLVAGALRGRIVLGLIVALTPMAIFTGAILNPSGIEVFSSVGFFISLLAVAHGRHPRLAVTAAAFTGTFVTMSRPFGPLWIFVSLATVICLVGFGRLWAAIRLTPLFAAAAVVLIGLGTMSTLLVLRLYTAPAKSVITGLPPGELRNIGNQAIDSFGWLDSPIPPNLVRDWLAVAVVLTALAFIFGNRRERVAVAVNTFLVYGFVYELCLHFLLPENTPPQGRHFLPILVLQPLTSVYVLSGQARRTRALVVGIPALLMVALQIVSWLANGAREGLGAPDLKLGSLPALTHRLLEHPPWAPPGGFLPWFVVLLLGCASLAAAATRTLVSVDDGVDEGRWSEPSARAGSSAVEESDVTKVPPVDLLDDATPGSRPQGHDVEVQEAVPFGQSVR